MESAAIAAEAKSPPSIIYDPLLKPRLRAYLKSVEDKKEVSRIDVTLDLTKRFPEYVKDLAMFRRNLDAVYADVLKEEDDVLGRAQHDLDEIIVDEVTGEYQLLTGFRLEFHWLDRLIIPPEVCAGCCLKGHATLDCPALRGGVASAACEYCNTYGHVVRACPKMHNLCHKCLCRGHWHGDCKSRNEAKWQRLKAQGVLTASDKFTFTVDKDHLVAEIRLRLMSDDPDLHVRAMPAYLWAWLKPKARLLAKPDPARSSAGTGVPTQNLDGFDWGNLMQLKGHLRCMNCFGRDHLSHARCPLSAQVNRVRCSYCNMLHHAVVACIVLHSLCLVCLRRGHTSGQCQKDDLERWSAHKHLGGLSAADDFAYSVRRADFVRGLKQHFSDTEWQGLLPQMPAFLQNWFLRDAEGVLDLVPLPDEIKKQRDAEAAVEIDKDRQQQQVNKDIPSKAGLSKRILLANPHWQLIVSFGGKQCSCCGRNRHPQTHCPRLYTAVCEYCAGVGHLVDACPVMQSACAECLRRGHETGRCAAAPDEVGWRRLKHQGIFSMSERFSYAVDKGLVVREVREAFGADLDPVHLPKHIREWLKEAEARGKHSELSDVITEPVQAYPSQAQASRLSDIQTDSISRGQSGNRNNRGQIHAVKAGTGDVIGHVEADSDTLDDEELTEEAESDVQTDHTQQKARIFAANQHWFPTLYLNSRKLCQCCGHRRHSSDPRAKCPVLDLAVCEYCGAKGHHLIKTCPLLHKVCLKCWRRGHQTGDCAKADEMKWNKLKDRGISSNSEKFVYAFDKAAVVKEIREAFGHALVINDFPKTLRRWFRET